MLAYAFRRTTILSWSLLLAGAAASACQRPASEHGALFEWTQLPALPEPLGVAGPCAGVSNGALVVAGGAHFPTPLFEGGPKVWTRAIHVMQPLAGRYRWQAPTPLPEARGYSASLNIGGQVLCIGGGNAERHFADVLSVEWRNGELAIGRTLPPLPHPLAFGAAARVGNTVYVAGGPRTPTSSTASSNFWALDVASPEKQWRKLEAWPGPARYDAVAAAMDGAFYLFSGVGLRPNPRGGVSHHFLRDAFRYVPERGWERLADLPSPVAAAPSPAVSYGPSHLLVFGGNDGSLVSRTRELRERHPGFRHEVLAYHTTTDTWTAIDTLPAAHVNTPVVHWDDRVVLASGEVRPGTRSPAIYAAVPTRPATTEFRIPDYLVLGAYFVLLAGMGFYFAGRGKSDDDFFLSRGRIPAWAAGLSIFGTQLSAITFMAIPAKAYAEDWVYILGQASIVLVAPIVVWVYLPFFRRLQVRTAYEYLERRFSLKVRLFGSLAFILLQLGRMAIVVLLPALALSTVAGFNIYLAIVLMGAVTTLYSALGGIEAVVWTDVLQVIVLLGGALVSVAIIGGSVEGGFAGLLSTAAAEGKLHTFTWTWDYTTTAVWVVLIGNLFGNLVPFTADQAVVQRYLTTRDQAAAARSIWTNAALTVPAALIFFGLGTALYVFYREHPFRLNPALQTDVIFPAFIVAELPTGVSGLLIAGLFAAAMSTLSSSVNSISSAIMTDFFRRLIPNTSARVRLLLSRWLSVLLGVLATLAALLLATYAVQSLWDVFLEMIGLFGGSLAGLFALGILTRRANAGGALVGAVTGVAVLALVKAFTAVHFFLYAPIGILTCFGVGYMASLLLRRPATNLEGLTIHSPGPGAKSSRYRAGAERAVATASSGIDLSIGKHGDP